MAYTRLRHPAGGGYYFLSLEPCFAVKAKWPILLAMEKIR